MLRNSSIVHVGQPLAILSLLTVRFMPILQTEPFGSTVHRRPSNPVDQGGSGPDPRPKARRPNTCGRIDTSPRRPAAFASHVFFEGLRRDIPNGRKSRAAPVRPRRNDRRLSDPNRTASHGRYERSMTRPRSPRDTSKGSRPNGIRLEVSGIRCARLPYFLHAWNGTAWNDPLLRIPNVPEPRTAEKDLSSTNDQGGCTKPVRLQAPVVA